MNQHRYNPRKVRWGEIGMEIVGERKWSVWITTSPPHLNETSQLHLVRGIPVVWYDQRFVTHVEVMVTGVGATDTEVAVIGRDDAAESGVAQLMWIRTICDGVVPGRAVDAPGYHEVTHSGGAGAGFVMIPGTG